MDNEVTISDLHQLTNEAYALFSPYKLSTDIAVCTHCCMSQQGVKKLKTLPVNQLSSRVIDEYLSAAAVRLDEQLIDQMRYLLPRVLQLLVAGEEFTHSSKLALDKLYCNHDTWLDAELAFLRRFAQSFLQYKLSLSSVSDSVGLKDCDGLENIVDLDDIIEMIVMFDNANLRDKNGKPFVNELFYVILKNAHKPNIIEQMIGLVYSKNLNPFASKALNQQVNKFIHSHDFKQAFITAVLDNIEGGDLSEGERNLYEVAFDVFSTP